jgi:hypothetical protein
MTMKTPKELVGIKVWHLNPPKLQTVSGTKIRRAPPMEINFVYVGHGVFPGSPEKNAYTGTIPIFPASGKKSRIPLPHWFSRVLIKRNIRTYTVIIRKNYPNFSG